jgi:hypothetical protein
MVGQCGVWCGPTLRGPQTADAQLPETSMLIRDDELNTTQSAVQQMLQQCSATGAGLLRSRRDCLRKLPCRNTVHQQRFNSRVNDLLPRRLTQFSLNCQQENNTQLHEPGATLLGLVLAMFYAKRDHESCLMGNFPRLFMVGSGVFVKRALPPLAPARKGSLT